MKKVNYFLMVGAMLPVVVMIIYFIIGRVAWVELCPWVLGAGVGSAILFKSYPTLSKYYPRKKRAYLLASVNIIVSIVMIYYILTNSILENLEMLTDRMLTYVSFVNGFLCAYWLWFDYQTQMRYK
jgi:hypothetical protein